MDKESINKYIQLPDMNEESPIEIKEVKGLESRRNSVISNILNFNLPKKQKVESENNNQLISSVFKGTSSEEIGNTNKTLEQKQMTLTHLLAQKMSDADFVEHNPLNMVKKSSWIIKDIFSYKKDT